MHKQIHLLAGLQGLDLKLDSFRGEKQVMEERILELDATLEKAQSGLAVMREDYASLMAAKEGLEANLATEQENIARSEARLKEIKTQKEYQAVSKEISAAKKMLAEIEEQIQAKESEIAQVSAELATGDANLQELTGNASSRADELRAEIRQMEDEVAGEVAEREKVVKALPQSLIRRYNMLRDQRRGLAVVEAREGSCLGCNMHIPPQLYNNLHRGDELISCPHCQRMLFIAPPQQEG